MISDDELELELQQIRELLKAWPENGLHPAFPGLMFNHSSRDVSRPPKSVTLLNGVGVFTRDQVFPEAPPLGLKPRKIHDEQRAVEIKEAILRYIAAKKQIPSEWYVELCELSPPTKLDNFELWHPIWDLLVQRELIFK